MATHASRHITGQIAVVTGFSIKSENGAKAYCLRYWFFGLRRPRTPYIAKNYLVVCNLIRNNSTQIIITALVCFRLTEQLCKVCSPYPVSSKIYPDNTMLTNRHVDFIICGTQKGGTTALNAYLRDHPDICLPDKKEVHFFDDEDAFVSNTPDYFKYHALFEPKNDNQLIGEATPIYMYWHEAPRRIWEYNPNIKLIVLLRNPIERAYSHWNMMQIKNMDDSSFWHAIQNEQERSRSALPLQHRVYSYIDRGFYLEQLRRLWMYFPKHQVLVIKNEHLKNQPNETLQVVCDFLGVTPFQSIEPKNKHSRPYTSTMSEKEKKHLRFIFEYEIREIERVLGWNCSDWLNV